MRYSGWPYGHPINTPFTINQYSRQARNLVLWMPFSDGQARVERVQNRLFTVAGSPGWHTTRGQTIDFEGSGEDQYVEIDIAPASLPFTITCWAKFKTASAFQTLVALSQTGTNYYDALRVDNNNKLNAISYYGAVGQAIATSTVALNTWVHCTAIFASATSRTVYMNVGSGDFDNANQSGAPNRTSIGRTGDDTPSNYMDGEMSDVRIYNRVLTLEEIRATYLNPWDLYRPVAISAAGMAVAATGIAHKMSHLSRFRRV